MLRLEEQKRKQLPVDEFERERIEKQKNLHDKAIDYSN
jgi:hypothetical protein